MSAEELADIISKRRQAVRERVKKCREQAKARYNEQNDNASEVSGSGSLAEIVGESYSNIQTVGKATKKVLRALPGSSRQKKAILANIIANLDETDKEQLVSVVAKPQTKKRKSAASKLIDNVRTFYEREDISRVSPNSEDVKKYKCPDTGEELYSAARHMVLSLKEAYAVFVEECEKEGIGMSILTAGKICSLFHCMHVFCFILRRLQPQSLSKTSTTTRQVDKRFTTQYLPAYIIRILWKQFRL